MAWETSTTPTSRKDDHDEMDSSEGALWWPANYALTKQRVPTKAVDGYVLIILNVPLTDREHVGRLLTSGVQAVDLL